MKTIKIKINGKEYLFICSARNTRTGFAHDCHLLINGVDKMESHAYYINRTWEVYTYQTVCLKSIDLLIQDRSDILKDRFMESHGYKKLTQKRAAIFASELEKDQTIMEFKAVRDKLAHNIY